VSFEALKEVVTEKTVAVIFAYLFGIRYSLEPYLDFLHEKKIEIIEDVAQSF